MANLQHVAYVSYVTAALGLAGSVFIIATYLLFKDTRNFGTQLVFCLSIADFVRGLLWYPWNVNHTLCVTQGVLTQFSEFAAFMWVFVIAMCMFQIYFLGASEERLRKLMVWFHVVCWGLSVIIALVPIVGDKYGELDEDKNWCWIKDTNDPERMLLYVPCVLIFVLNSLAYFLITIRLRTITSVLRNTLEKNMALYLLAFVLSQAPTVALRMYMFFDENGKNSFDFLNMTILVLLQAIFQPLQGLLDALVYGVNDPSFTTNYKRFATLWLRHREYAKIQDAKTEFFFDYEYTSNSDYSKTINAMVAADSHPHISSANTSLN